MEEWIAYCETQCVHSKLHEETKSINMFLCSMNAYGFLTMSSQPQSHPRDNPVGVHAYQRAYVSGYMPKAMKDYLYHVLPRDLVIWESGQKSSVPIAFDNDEDGIIYPNTTRAWNSWSGEMEGVDIPDTFSRLNVVPFHVMDVDWSRNANYLCSEVIRALEEWRNKK